MDNSNNTGTTHALTGEQAPASATAQDAMPDAAQHSTGQPAPDTQDKPEPTPGITFTDTTFRFPLEHPIMIGEERLEWLTLRLPRAGELRGLNLLDLSQLDVDTLLTLLPRISTPTILRTFGAQLHPADLITIGKGVSGFFGSDKQRRELLEQMQAVRSTE